MLFGIIILILMVLVFVLYCCTVAAGRYDKCCYDTEQEKILAEYMEKIEED
jgi:hypothetical protein